MNFRLAEFTPHADFIGVKLIKFSAFEDHLREKNVVNIREANSGTIFFSYRTCFISFLICSS